ncbi:MAG TPA: hypothetical protein VFA50_12805 [Stellaceae bacterium]|nr:hypothetical protein [Stellaceae bacterium]
MDRRAKVELLTGILLAGYGAAAPDVALRRARACRRSRDYASAMVWLDVVLRAGSRTPRRAEAAASRRSPAAEASARRDERRDGLVAFVRRLKARQPRRP